MYHSKSMLFRVYRGALFGVLVAISLGIWGGSDASAQERVVPKSKQELQLSYAPLVEQAAPAVVNIFTAKKVRRRQLPALFDDPFFRRFFGDDFGGGFGGPKGRSRQRVQNSLGSGVIIRADGLIVTNNHVIEGADEITVVLSDRRELSAEIVGTDERTDLAILKIQSENGDLPILDLADSDSVLVGDIVLAIGNPFGVGQTVTSGIVSAVARTQINKTDLSFFIQTDAAINPGNSGGALIGLDGRLIGINTAIFSKTGGSHGIGFAIPSNLVRAVINGVVRDGRLVRPWFGAAGQVVNGDIANSIGLDRPGGVLVNEVYGGAAADKAGLKTGDVVLAVNGHEVKDPSALKFRIATATMGEIIPVRIWRKGNLKALRLKLEPPPEKPARDETLLDGSQPLSGATVVNLSPALADELGTDPFAQGVMVLDVQKGTSAARRGFRRGDVVRRINQREIEDVDRLTRVLRRGADEWRITIQRRGRELTAEFPG